MSARTAPGSPASNATCRSRTRRLRRPAQIIEAQIAPVDAPLVSAIPSGTTLRAVFLTEQGAAFVDLSREVSAAHPGGSINELLTIYTIVQALTTNLPAVTSVQLLVDGKEVDTLAGHVDVKRPLAQNRSPETLGRISGSHKLQLSDCSGVGS